MALEAALNRTRAAEVERKEALLREALANRTAHLNSQSGWHLLPDPAGENRETFARCNVTTCDKLEIASHDGRMVLCWGGSGGRY